MTSASCTYPIWRNCAGCQSSEPDRSHGEQQSDTTQGRIELSWYGNHGIARGLLPPSLAAATRAAASAAFRRRTYPRPPGLAVAGAGIGLFVDFALVAEYEVGESYTSFAIYPSGMVVVCPLRVVGRGSPLPIARI